MPGAARARSVASRSRAGPDSSSPSKEEFALTQGERGHPETEGCGARTDELAGARVELGGSAEAGGSRTLAG